MSLATLAPHFVNEMEDSAMQEDHPVDSAIAIDMESPKHHVLTPQGTSYADSTAAPTFWSHSQSQGTADELVDVEFETAGAYEDDGMMAATEVEMTAAVPYEEDNELEMAYENGQPEFNYEVEDAEVRDAEVTYDGHSHEQHAASHFVPVEHEQPQEIFVSPAPETGSFEASDSLPLAEVAADTGPPEEDDRSEAAPAEGVSLAPLGVDEHAEDLTGEAHLSAGIVGIPVEVAPVEDFAHEPSLEPAEEKPLAPSPIHEKPQQSPGVDVVNADEQAAVYEANPQEEEEAEARYVLASPPILLTTFSGSSKSSVVALFNEPDVAMVPSSSKTASEPPVVLLDQHQYLFGEPVAAMLAQLRMELLQAEPEIISASEFEYKEVQLVVRDLQLVLTEDNIYSREISLFDLESMHRSCGLSGYLHLDFSLQPRFIDRYRAIRQAIEAQGIMNNPDLVSQQEAREDEENADGEDTAIPTNKPKGQHDRPDYDETVEGDQALSRRKDGDDQGVAEEEEAEEPPLPLDDGEASSWSEEQEDDGQEEYQAAEGHAEKDWEDTHETDAAAADEVPTTKDVEEGIYEEEYLHEDDYVPGDLVRIEDEGDFPADPGEQPEEQAADVTSNEVKEAATGENDHDDVDANVTTAEVDAAVSEEYPVHTDNTADETNEYKDEGATVADGTEYVDDENEWDDLGYSADPDNIQEDSALARPTSPHQVDSNAVHETKSPDVPWDGNGVREAHAELTPPQRKRSFSEVEAEPEGDLTLSPGSKKPRHL